MTRRSRKRAFTLIELLVVIAVMAILMSILLPALRRAREQAAITVCATNLHQVFIAFNNYADENRGIFPQTYYKKGNRVYGNVVTSYWPKPEIDKLVGSYLGNVREVFYCKSWMSSMGRDLDYWWNIGDHWSGYPNERLVSYHTTTHQLLRDEAAGAPYTNVYDDIYVKFNSEMMDKMLIADDTFHYTTRTDTELDWNGGGRVAHWASNHNEPAGANVAYVGGHVEWKPYSEMKLRYYYSLSPLKGAFW